MWVEVCLWAGMAELGCKTCKTPFKTLQDIMLMESKVVHMGEVHGVSTNGCPQPPPRVTHGMGVHGHACGLSMVAPLVGGLSQILPKVVGWAHGVSLTWTTHGCGGGINELP